MRWLLDGNVLVAAVLDTHLHHRAALRWLLVKPRRRFATCVITQGALLRLHMMQAEDRSASAAWARLHSIVALPQHEYWADGFSYDDVPHRHLQGHAQVTDAWLAQLARRRKGRVATFDGAFAALHADVADPVPLDE